MSPIRIPGILLDSNFVSAYRLAVTRLDRTAFIDAAVFLYLVGIASFSGISEVPQLYGWLEGYTGSKEKVTSTIAGNYSNLDESRDC
jgi:hypothetical protein